MGGLYSSVAGRSLLLRGSDPCLAAPSGALPYCLSRAGCSSSGQQGLACHCAASNLRSNLARAGCGSSGRQGLAC
eukprot:13843317-Alexandrium_andersonii.AAC.1